MDKIKFNDEEESALWLSVFDRKYIAESTTVATAVNAADEALIAFQDRKYDK